ncbi:MAG: pyrroline-5-carboxylate reductase [Azospirillaceae bacterium]
MAGRLLLVGCGKMGGALLEGWLAAGQVAAVDVVEPGEAPVPESPLVTRHTEAASVTARPDVILLAVKPQVMDDVAPAFVPLADQDTLIISIAAGKTIAGFERLYGADRPIVRAMPNTPAAVGEGVSVLVANHAAGEDQRTVAEALLSAVGSVEWVEDEALIDAVTALSGGGPAYVFLLIEALAEAGRKAGLPVDLAMRLARRTVIGAGVLADRSDEEAAQLRRNVTSPRGTTEAALKVLMAEDGIQPLFDRAIAAATARSRELAQ